MTVLVTENLAAASEIHGRAADIYLAAAELMVQNGFGGTSISDIAKAVGMTKAGLYHHISSKQDMLFQIMQHAMNVLEQAAVEPARQVEDPEERLRTIIELHIRAIFVYGSASTVLFSEVHHLDPSQKETIIARVQGYKRFIRETLLEMDDAGKLRDLDIDVATRHILHTIVGVARWYKPGADQGDDHVIKETVDFALSAVSNRS
jgi:AcrR family transcriptional regulator